MSTTTQSIPAFAPSSQRIPAAAFEVLCYLGVVAIGTLCFLLGWLGINGAVVLGTLLLLGLTALAWNRFDGGRHPCFLFLCMLTLFQGGRLISYCLGGLANPFQIDFMTAHPFMISQDEAGIVLLLILVSAICIYAPCRWNYRYLLPQGRAQARRYLPYLYLILICSLPIQLFKNYRYFQYAQEHGGYLFLYVDHAALAASVPLLVRAISLITFPAFVAIFVFEERKKLVYLTTFLYFGTSVFILLLGSRGATFTLIVALWYVARMKSTTRPRTLRLTLLVLGLMLVANVLNLLRSGSDTDSLRKVGPTTFITQQGVSLAVTEVAVKYREVFAPYAASYLWNELKTAFVANDTGNYFRGRALGFDISVLLNPAAFSQGYGTGGTYLAEAYILGGLCGVVVISLLVGAGLHLLYTGSRTAVGLFVVAMILPEVLWMSRGSLLGWVSVMIRNSISIFLLIMGWWFYISLFSGHQVSPATNHGMDGSTAELPGGG